MKYTPIALFFFSFPYELNKIVDKHNGKCQYQIQGMNLTVPRTSNQTLFYPCRNIYHDNGLAKCVDSYKLNYLVSMTACNLYVADVE